MTQLKPGDCVTCCLKDKYIVSPYQEHDEIMQFEIVAQSGFGYYAYVPHYLFLNKTVRLSETQCVTLGINKRFYHQNFVYIRDNYVHEVKKVLDGMLCCKCGDFFLMAAPNQEDQTLICYSCRINPYR